MIELSVVMPCLNESDTVGTCIDKAMAAMAAHGIAGEVVVADNGRWRCSGLAGLTACCPCGLSPAG